MTSSILREYANLFESKNLSCDELIDFIIKNCRPFLEQNKNLDPLYRGMHNRQGVDSGEGYIQTVRTDRTPRDTKKVIHDYVDKYLDARGFEANRSNSMFVTGNYVQASNYGTAMFLVFPIGSFRFTWSISVPDLFWIADDYPSVIRMRYREENPDALAGINITSPDEDELKFIENFLDENLLEHLQTYQETDLNEAIGSGNEIMIRANEVLCVRIDGLVQSKEFMASIRERMNA